MKVRHASYSLLVCGLVSGLACASAPGTPLTTASLDAWLKKVCAAATCREVPASSLIPTHVTHLFPESRAYVVTRAGHRFYLLHDFAPVPAQFPLQELTFMPYRLSDKWTPAKLNIVAGWLISLAGGQLSADHMWKCVSRLKWSEQTYDLLDIDAQDDSLRHLSLNDVESATGACWWLPGKRNVAFGFIGKGRF